MAVNVIQHRRNSTTADTRRLPSPAIWADCPWDDIDDPRSGIDGVTFHEVVVEGNAVDPHARIVNVVPGAVGPDRRGGEAPRVRRGAVPAMLNDVDSHESGSLL